MNKANDLILGKNGTKVSAPQKRFNKLQAKIQKLEEQITLYTNCYTRFGQLEAKLVAPVLKKYYEIQVRHLFLLDRRLAEVKLKKGQREGVEHFIEINAFELIEEGFKELIPLHDKYSEELYEDVKKNNGELAGEIKKDFIKNEFNIDIEEDIDWDNIEEVTAFAERAKAKREQEEWEKLNKQGKKQENPSNAAIRREEEAGLMKKSVRSIYLNLVKAYHPDKEKDDAEKERKSEVMKDITKAYEENDLLELLRLQLQMEDVSADKLDSLSEDKLKHINKILSNQAMELEETLEDMEEELEELLEDSVHRISLESVEKMVKSKQRKIKAQIKYMDGIMEGLRSDAAFFKKIATDMEQFKEEQEKEDDFFDFPFDF